MKNGLKVWNQLCSRYVDQSGNVSTELGMIAMSQGIPFDVPEHWYPAAVVAREEIAKFLESWADSIRELNKMFSFDGIEVKVGDYLFAGDNFGELNADGVFKHEKGGYTVTNGLYWVNFNNLPENLQKEAQDYLKVTLMPDYMIHFNGTTWTIKDYK